MESDFSQHEEHNSYGNTESWQKEIYGAYILSEMYRYLPDNTEVKVYLQWVSEKSTDISYIKQIKTGVLHIKLLSITQNAFSKIWKMLF